MDTTTSSRRRLPAAIATALAAAAVAVAALTVAPAPAGATQRPPADPAGAFLYRGGRFTPLGGIPGAALAAHVAINDRGQAAGFYLDAGVTPDPGGGAPPGSIHGFIKDRRGRLTRFDVPGAGATLVVGSNDRGQVAGTWFEGGYPPAAPGSSHGFVRHPDGAIATIDLPGATDTAITDINNRGQVAGQYRDSAGAHGFLRDRDGKVTTIDVPGAALVTEFLTLNDRGQVAGQYDDNGVGGNEPNSRHGFVWDRGRLTRFDVPGSLSTGALGINNLGQITGSDADAAGRQHGFVLRRGRYTTIDAPGRTATDAWGINDLGEVVVPDIVTGLLPVTR